MRVLGVDPGIHGGLAVVGRGRRSAASGDAKGAGPRPDPID